MKNYLIVILFATSGTLLSQNLVLNPSFELNSVVGGTYATYQGDVNNWHNPSNATPDYFIPSLSIPGYVVYDPQPHSGNAFAGLVVISGPTTPNPNWREYLQGELSTPLTANVDYCIEFYLNLRDSDVIGTQNLEIHFNNTLISDPTNTRLSYTAHSTIDISAFDTISWRKLTANYTATGGEQYFTIGNFNPNASQIVYYQPLYYPVAYYYIDDFTIYDCNTSPNNSFPSPANTICSNLQIPNAFSPNKDGHNDNFSLAGWSSCVSEFNIMIFNRWGEKVFQSFDVAFQWDGIHNKSQISFDPNGLMNSEVLTYYITATLNSGEKIIKKGNISLLK